VHNAETCVEEGPQEASGEGLEIRNKPGADGGAEYKQFTKKIKNSE
jgi:hypothetical protein